MLNYLTNPITFKIRLTRIIHDRVGRNKQTPTAGTSVAGNVLRAEQAFSGDDAFALFRQ
jgi:hypothetical protein